MDNNLIIIKQLPIIEQQLMAVKEEISARVQDALSLECSADTVKEIKKVRAELNREHTEFESRRKAVKKAIMAPYEEFEALYRECISDQYKNADEEFKHRIAEIESTVLNAKFNEAAEYFNEYSKSAGIDFVPFETAVPQITMSVSMKRLKEQAKNFIDKVSNDIKLINSMPFSTEIMIEYKACCDITRATQTVLDRHEKMEIEESLTAIAREMDEATINELTAEDPEPLPAPTETEEVHRMSFRVTGTIKQLKALKEYMTEQGIEFEGIQGGTK